MRIARVAEDGRAAGSGVEEKADVEGRRGKRKGQMVKFGGNLRANGGNLMANGGKLRANGKNWGEFEGRI